MNSPSKIPKIPSSSTKESQNDKTDTKNIQKNMDINIDGVQNKKINVNLGKNFILKTSFKKMDDTDNEITSYIYDNYTNLYRNKNIFNDIIYYYESTYEHLKKYSEYDNSFNWKNSKNYKIRNYPLYSSDSEKKISECDKIEKLMNSCKEIRNKNERTFKNNDVSNNVLIINNINISVSNSNLKNNNDCDYYINNYNINEHGNQNKNEYFSLNNMNLLNRKKAEVQFNNYVNNNVQEIKNGKFTNFNNNLNYISNSKNNVINFIKYEPNIDNPPFFPSNFNKNNTELNTVNNNKDLSELKKSEIIKNPENSINLKKDNQSKNESEDNLQPEEYLVKMYGRIGWICLYCDNFNYETRYKCNKCGLLKKPKKLMEITEKKDGQIIYNIYNNKDWFCNNCKNLNYSFRKVCNRCKLPKPSENNQIMLPFSEIMNNSTRNNVNNNNLLNFSMGKFYL